MLALACLPGMNPTWSLEIRLDNIRFTLVAKRSLVSLRFGDHTYRGPQRVSTYGDPCLSSLNILVR